MNSEISDNEIKHAPELDKEVSQEERDKIRSEISTMSFEDLQKLKEQIGAKVYDETIFGVKSKPHKTLFKRINKNRPREMSSKIRPEKVKIIQPKIQVKKPIQARDPRFDPLCGTFDKATFQENYKFIDDLKKSERKELVKQLGETEDRAVAKNIKLLIQRIDNQVRDLDKNRKNAQKEKAEKSEIKNQLKRGEKPTYKKKSVKRIEDLVSKYEELKKSNKLQKHIEKRTKKMLKKDRNKVQQ